MKALRISEAIGAVASQMRVIFMGMSYRGLSPVSSHPETPQLVWGWIPGKRPGTTSGAAIELRQREFPVSQHLGSGEAAVGRADDHVDERIAGGIKCLLAAQDARDVDIDVLAHGAHGLGVARDL